MRRALLPAILVALLLAPGASAWTWPAAGPVLQPFLFDPAHPYAAGQHRGVDLGGAEGSPVLAPATGTVSFAGVVPSSGKSVTIETPEGYSVTLTHLGSISVVRSAAVAEGGPVGTIGPSGDGEVPQPYVHLGVRLTAQAQAYLDPLTLLPPRGAAPPADPAPVPSATPVSPPAPVSVPAPPPVPTAAVAAPSTTPTPDQAASPATVTPPSAATAAPSPTVVAASAHEARLQVDGAPAVRGTAPRGTAGRRAERRGTVRRGAGQHGAARLGVTSTANARRAAERSTSRVPAVLRTIAARAHDAPSGPVAPLSLTPPRAGRTAVPARRGRPQRPGRRAPNAAGGPAQARTAARSPSARAGATSRRRNLRLEPRRIPPGAPAPPRSPGPGREAAKGRAYHCSRCAST